MFRQAENRVKIEGILSEIDLKHGSYNREGTDVEYIGGNIKVLVNQVINGVETDLEVPVYVFAPKTTKAGKMNPSYESIETVYKEFKSIAMTGDKNTADKIRITNGSIRMNDFVGQDRKIKSVPRINASFISKATGEFKPQANFTLEFSVGKKYYVENEGEGSKYIVEVVVPQYTSPNAEVMNVDIVPLTAISESVIDAIEQYWTVGDTFKANGRLNFTSRTETTKQEVGFGEALESVHTINISEFIITGGSQAPLDGDFAFDVDAIKAGIAARKERHEKMLSGEDSKAKKAPIQNSTKGKQDLGF